MRDISDTRSYSNVAATAAYTHCLLRANYDWATVKGIELQPGQFITSIESFARECGLSEKQMRTALQKLEEDGLITREPAQKVTNNRADSSVNNSANIAKKNGTLITVVNYGFDGQTTIEVGDNMGEEMEEEKGNQPGNSIIIKKNNKEYKDTRNINPDGLMDGDKGPYPNDTIQRQIEEIVEFMNEMGFDYSSANGKGGIRGILGKYLRKDKVSFHILVGYVYKTVDRESADRGSEDDLAYLIRCMK